MFEARDSFLMRLANILKLSPSYELEAVIGHKFKFGGLNNSNIPNFIYRWTEREIKKTISSYNPKVKHSFLFFYSLLLPYQASEMKKTMFKYIILKLSDLPVRFFTLFFKKQCNNFGIVILKPKIPQDLLPWLCLENDCFEFNKDYAKKYFKI